MKLSPCTLIFEASERSRPALDVHDMVARLCETVVAPWRIITAQGKAMSSLRSIIPSGRMSFKELSL